MTAGRPSKYTEEMIQKVNWYLDNFQSTGLQEIIPTVEGLALHLNITKATVYDWIKHEDKQEFSYAVKKVLQKQGLMLANRSLDGTYNSTVAGILLSNHDYIKKDKTDHSSSDGSMKPTTIVLEAKK